MERMFQVRCENLTGNSDVPDSSPNAPWRREIISTSASAKGNVDKCRAKDIGKLCDCVDKNDTVVS